MNTESTSAEDFTNLTELLNEELRRNTELRSEMEKQTQEVANAYRVAIRLEDALRAIARLTPVDGIDAVDIARKALRR